MQFDVVIVGAGAVGTALACALSQIAPSLTLALIEAEAAEPAHFAGVRYDPRVVAISPRTARFLQALGVWDSMLAERICPYREMYVWDALSSGSIEFDAADIHAESLGYIAENSVLLRSLRQQARRNPKLQWIAPAAVTAMADMPEPWRQRLSLSDGRRVDARLVVAADGGSSMMRALAGIRTREWDYQQTAIVTTVRTELSHRQTAWQCFTPEGPVAFLPLSDPAGGVAESCYCSIVWSLNDDVVGDRLALDDAAFCRVLERAFETRLGRVLEAEQRFGHPLRQRHAVDYYRPGLALIGDAAHTIHPLAGQGMNLGFYDVQVLAQEMQRAVQRGYSVGEELLLRRYQRQRKVHNLGIMTGMEAFKRLFGTAAPWAITARSLGLNWTNRQRWLKRYFVEAAAGNVY